MTMDSVSEFMGYSRYITKLAGEVQKDEALFSLAIAREGSSTLACLWEDVDTLLFDHTLRVVVEIRVEILHHGEMEIVRLLEGEVLIRCTHRSSYIPDGEIRFKSEHLRLRTEESRIDRIGALDFREEHVDDLIIHLFGEISLSHDIIPVASHLDF